MFRIIDWNTAMFLTNENKFSFSLDNAKQFHERSEAVSFLVSNQNENVDFRLMKVNKSKRGNKK